MSSEKTVIASCAQQRYEIRQTDLPLSCPLPSMEKWDAHPRVYLDIATKGQTSCPYCGALYVLMD